jgi:hypothetical protein
MLCFIDLEHERYLADPKDRGIHFIRTLDNKLKLEGVTVDVCLVQLYSHIDVTQLAGWGVWALVISGNVTGWPEYDPVEHDDLKEIIRATPVPTIGSCGGYQLIATTMGVTALSIRQLVHAEHDPLPDFGPPAYVKEFGFSRVHVTVANPLFEELPAEPTFVLNVMKMTIQTVGRRRRTIPGGRPVFSSAPRSPGIDIQTTRASMCVAARLEKSLTERTETLPGEVWSTIRAVVERAEAQIVS